jgi:hypothetical protein
MREYLTNKVAVRRVCFNPAFSIEGIIRLSNCVIYPFNIFKIRFYLFNFKTKKGLKNDEVAIDLQITCNRHLTVSNDLKEG